MTGPRHRPDPTATAGAGGRLAATAVHPLALGLSACAAYLASTWLLSVVSGVTDENAQLGGMWSAIAAVFVQHGTVRGSRAFARSRVVATVASFALCEAWLLAFPAGGPALVVALAVVIAVGGLGLQATGLGRAVGVFAITTIVVLVVAAGGPAGSAWQQPLLRLVDTVVGAAVGLLVAVVVARVVTRRRRPRPVLVQPEGQ